MASTHSSSHAEIFLQTLTPQCREQKIEIIIAHSGAHGGAHGGEDAVLAELARLHRATLLSFPAGTTLPRLWGAALARSTGEIIAVAETTCVPAADWVASIIAAHEASAPVIGGAVEPAGCDTLLDWAAFFCEYGQFLRPVSEGAVSELPGNNLSFKRWVMEVGPELVAPEFWKTYWCRRLRAAGIVLQSTSSVAVYYRKSYRLWPFLARRFHHGRCFAGMRVARWSALRRAGYALGTLLLPLLFLARVVRAVAPKRRYLRQFILALPFSVLAMVSWSVGECCGYLTGAGRSCGHVR